MWWGGMSWCLWQHQVGSGVSAGTEGGLRRPQGSLLAAGAALGVCGGIESSPGGSLSVSGKPLRWHQGQLGGSRWQSWGAPMV